jgi:hypothetical protein
MSDPELEPTKNSLTVHPFQDYNSGDHCSVRHIVGVFRVNQQSLYFGYFKVYCYVFRFLIVVDHMIVSHRTCHLIERFGFGRVILSFASD